MPHRVTPKTKPTVMVTLGHQKPKIPKENCGNTSFPNEPASHYVNTTAAAAAAANCLSCTQHCTWHRKPREAQTVPAYELDGFQAHEK